MPKHTISINSTPVLTRWADIVAEWLDFHRDEALKLGWVVAGLNPQAKGRRLGIYKPHEDERVRLTDEYQDGAADSKKL